MKKLIYGCCLLSSMYLFQACGDGNSTSSTDSTKAMTTDTSTKMQADTSKKMTDSASSMNAQPVDKMDAEFATKAATGGMMEVELGKIAQDKAENPRVKNFGAMMVTDHSKANDDLKATAASQNITLPSAVTSSQQKEIDMLSKKTGKDFDKAYMSMMLDDHKTDIGEFRKASDKCKNPNVKDFATKTLPTLEKHLDSVKAIMGKS